MTPIENQLFTYRAQVVSIYDGDTIRVDIDLGFSQWSRNIPVRLAGLDAPEIRGVERIEGLLSKDWLVAQIPPGTWITIKTQKDRKEKFGRYLAKIQMPDGSILNAAMIAAKFAAVYMPDIKEAV